MIFTPLALPAAISSPRKSRCVVGLPGISDGQARALEGLRPVDCSAGLGQDDLFVLDETHRCRRPEAGDLALLLSFGAGFSAHALLLEY